MNRTCRRVLGALSITWGLAAAAPASAQVSVTANGPYYATPSWSQKLTRNRFVVLADWNHEAVLDRETGLVWQRSPLDIDARWGGAINGCFATLVGGRLGWRLPSLPEMASLLDQPSLGQVRRLPDGHPFENVTPVAQTLEFWTRTRSVDSADRAYLVVLRAPFDLDPSQFFPTAAFSGQHRYWCVRGDSGPDGS